MAFDTALKLLSKIAHENKIKEAIQRGVNNNYFDNYSEDWNYLKQYYKKFKKLTLEVLKEQLQTPSIKEIEAYDFDYLIDKLKNDYLKGEFVNALKTTADDIVAERKPIKDIIDKHNNILRQLNIDLGSGFDTNITKDAMTRYDELQKRREIVKNRGLAGITTGIKILDDYTGGILKNDLWVIAGRTGVGKSWLTLKMASEAWKAGFTPLMINLEMGVFEVGFRLDTLISEDFSNMALVQGKLDDVETMGYKKFLERNLSKARDFWLVTRTRDSVHFTLSDLEAKIIEYSPDIIFIDYLNLLTTTAKFRSIWEKVTVLTRDLKSIARQNIPIVIVVQASRQATKGMPQIEHMANSDSVGRDADKILSIMKMKNKDDDKDYLRCALIKNRSGKGIGEFYLAWDVDTGKIYESSIVKTGTTIF